MAVHIFESREKDLLSCSFVQKIVHDSIANFQDIRTYSPTHKAKLIIVKLSSSNTTGS